MLFKFANPKEMLNPIETINLLQEDNVFEGNKNIGSLFSHYAVFNPVS
jgi:hypothetical protein